MVHIISIINTYFKKSIHNLNIHNFNYQYISTNMSNTIKFTLDHFKWIISEFLWARCSEWVPTNQFPLMYNPNPWPRVSDQYHRFVPELIRFPVVHLARPLVETYFLTAELSTILRPAPTGATQVHKQPAN